MSTKKVQKSKFDCRRKRVDMLISKNTDQNYYFLSYRTEIASIISAQIADCLHGRLFFATNLPQLSHDPHTASITSVNLPLGS